MRQWSMKDRLLSIAKCCHRIGILLLCVCCFACNESHSMKMNEMDARVPDHRSLDGRCEKVCLFDGCDGGRFNKRLVSAYLLNLSHLDIVQPGDGSLDRDEVSGCLLVKDLEGDYSLAIDDSELRILCEASIVSVRIIDKHLVQIDYVCDTSTSNGFISGWDIMIDGYTTKVIYVLPWISGVPCDSSGRDV